MQSKLCGRLQIYSRMAQCPSKIVWEILFGLPVFLPRCHRRERLWRWEKRSTCRARLVYCWTLIQRKLRRLLENPILPTEPPCVEGGRRRKGGGREGEGERERERERERFILLFMNKQAWTLLRQVLWYYAPRVHYNSCALQSTCTCILVYL